MGNKRKTSREERSQHGAVYQRAAWQCQMPECLCPDGRKIDRRLRGTDDPWAPSIDHIVPVAAGGSGQMRNKRAAHRECNRDAAELQLNRPARPKPPPLTVTIGDLFPALALLGRQDPDL